MKIIIDAMGGDNAPLEIVKGALLGMEHWGVEVLLTGDTEAILRKYLETKNTKPDRHDQFISEPDQHTDPDEAQQ